MMIQEIAPHVYDLSYATTDPRPEDRIICCAPGKVLLRKLGDTWEFPCLSYLQGEGCPELLIKHYLFRLDGEDCYLAKVKLSENVPADGEIGAGTLPEDLVWCNNDQVRDAQPMSIAFAAVTAQHLNRWYQNRTFCGRCGSKMEYSKTERAMVCPDCHLTEYPKIVPGVIVAVTNGDKILLTKSRLFKARNYALISGYVEIGESIEQTIEREVREEVGLKIKNLRYYKSQPWGFSDTLMIGYYCEVDGPSEITRDDAELSEAVWMTREEMPSRANDVSLTAEMMELFRHGGI